jgi:plastocyanin
VGTAPAKYVDFTYTYQDELGRNINGFEYQLIVLSNDSDTGYVIIPTIPLTRGEIQLSPEMIQVLNSFALVLPTISTIATTTSPPLTTASEPQEELQQVPSSPLTQQLQLPAQEQQLQNSQTQGASVSIVSGSSSFTTDAYAPNPIQVSTGATVTWTNDDSQPHTATSGEDATPDQQFESGIMAPGATFEHTFTEPGDYPYFCLLHPNMVGTVSVG